MDNKKYTFQHDENLVCTTKCVVYSGMLGCDEVEVTKEQYNQVSEFPIKLTIENGKVVAWEKTELEYEPVPETQREPTVEDYLVDLDFRVSKIELGLEV